jgi:hypothetical protein
MIAHRISTAVLERIGHRPLAATVVAGSRAAVHIDLAGFVVSLTGPHTPLMPNGIALAAPLPSPAPARAGDRVWVGAGYLRAPGGIVAWDADAPPLWEPRLAPWRGPCAPDVARRADAICERLRAALVARDAPALPAPEPSGAAVADLLRAVADRRPESARAAAIALVGSGPGLTPVGDDLLAGTAATVATLGDAVGFDAPDRRAWLDALRPPHLRRLTTSVSATLLDLAVDGRAAEPLHALLSDLASHTRSADAVDRLQAVGASTGRAYAFAVGAAALQLARPGAPLSFPLHKEPT